MENLSIIEGLSVYNPDGLNQQSSDGTLYFKEGTITSEQLERYANSEHGRPIIEFERKNPKSLDNDILEIYSLYNHETETSQLFAGVHIDIVPDIDTSDLFAMLDSLFMEEKADSYIVPITKEQIAPLVLEFILKEDESYYQFYRNESGLPRIFSEEELQKIESVAAQIIDGAKTLDEAKQELSLKQLPASIINDSHNMGAITIPNNYLEKS